MLATFLIEFMFAFYTIWRYKMNTIVRLCFLLLISLGTFQLAEYMVCGGLGWSNVEWARVGYGSITLLPALGIHLTSAIAGKKNWLLIGSAYASCALFVAFYLVAEGAISGQTCYPNYAVFDTHRASVIPFTIYYYGWLMIGVYLAWNWGVQMKDRARKTALYSTMIGYLIFIVPTIAFNIVDPSTTKGIPSIMCGFAVLLAFIIVGKVLPSCCKDNSSAKAFFAMLKI
jgi:hypothetical protein